MPFIGNQPALSYTSFAKQDFTTSATTSYTLDNPVANENEIALFINFVRQEPTTAYTASGTSLTLTSATSASDDMYCVYLGKAVQTVNPPNGSVGTAQIADLAVTSGKLASGVLPTNTPAFLAKKTSNQTISDNTFTKVAFAGEEYDTNSAYASNKFTVPSGEAGKYTIYGNLQLQANGGDDLETGEVSIRINGSEAHVVANKFGGNPPVKQGISFLATIALSVSDYVEIYAKINSVANADCFVRQETSGLGSYFGAYKIIE